MALRLSALDLQRCYSSYKQDVHGQLPDFRADWAKASADDKEKIFQRECAFLNDSYKHLGLIGELFIDSFSQTGCQEIKVLDDKQTPSFQGHNFSSGHQNKILFGGWCFDDREKFQDSSNHERTHAIQDSISAIAHATPYNGHKFTLVKPLGSVPVGAQRRIVLAPRAYMLLEELKERGAYAMQKILSELRSADFDPVQQLGKNLQEYAGTVLEKWDVAGSKPVISHLTHYREKAFDNYQNMMIDPQGKPYDQDVIYVTFEAADIAALGHICGLTIFGEKKDDMQRWSATPLSAAHQTWAQELTTTLAADKSVPFKVALQALGMTPPAFLAHSRTSLPVKVPLWSPRCLWTPNSARRRSGSLLNP